MTSRSENVWLLLCGIAGGVLFCGGVFVMIHFIIKFW